MDRDELTLRRNLSESKEWKAIRQRLLDFCSLQSSNEPFCDKYVRGVLYGIRAVDTWADAYYAEIDKEKQRKGVV